MASTTVSKNKQGYGYKYTDLAEIHEYLESIGMKYYQYIENVGEYDYIYTVPIKVLDDGTEQELNPRRGCRIIQATLSGKSNPAQENGSAITYARRYSLLMAFGLATDDDDAQSLTKYDDKESQNKQNNSQPKQESQIKPVETPKPSNKPAYFSKKEEKQEKPVSEEVLSQLEEPVDEDLLPIGEGMTERRLKKLKKAQEFTNKNDATVLATARAKTFEEITEASYISVMNLFLRLLTPEQKAEIESIQ